MPFLKPEKYRPRGIEGVEGYRPPLKVLRTASPVPSTASPARYTGRAWHEGHTMDKMGPEWVLATTLRLMGWASHDRCIIVGEGDTRYIEENRKARTLAIIAEQRVIDEREAREWEAYLTSPGSVEDEPGIMVET